MMPCDTVQLNSVDLDVAAKNPALLRKALEAMGARNIRLDSGRAYFTTAEGYSVSVSGGQLQTAADNPEEIASLVKRSYSAEVVKFTAARNGWKVQQTAQFAYNIIKR
jgi:hypothetical protein